MFLAIVRSSEGQYVVWGGFTRAELMKEVRDYDMTIVGDVIEAEKLTDPRAEELEIEARKLNKPFVDRIKRENPYEHKERKRRR